MIHKGLNSGCKQLLEVIKHLKEEELLFKMGFYQLRRKKGEAVSNEACQISAIRKLEGY